MEHSWGVAGRTWGIAGRSWDVAEASEEKRREEKRREEKRREREREIWTGVPVIPFQHFSIFCVMLFQYIVFRFESL